MKDKVKDALEQAQEDPDPEDMEYSCPYCDFIADTAEEEKNHRWQKHGKKA